MNDTLIYCYDENTKQILITNGYKLLREDEKFSIFSNNVKDSKLNFSDYNKHIKFSNMMLF